MAAADDAEQGVAAGVLNTATQLGTAIGVAVIGTLAAWRTAASDAPRDAALVEGFDLGWLVAAAWPPSRRSLRRRGDEPAHRARASASVRGA